MCIQLKQKLLSVCLLASASIASAGELPYTQRIVGGQAMEISQAPATVALINNSRYETDGDLTRSVFCGGTVISPRWVMTAAHCFVDENNAVRPPSAASVLMGTTDLREPVNQTIAIAEIIVHEDYSDLTNDIALLRLASDSLVPPMALDKQETELNEIGVVAGWGALNSGGAGQPQQFPAVLQAASVYLMPGDLCGEIAPSYAGLTDERNLCAGIPDGGIDSCQGDSGGPLYRYSESNEQLISVAGIVSWGFGCAEAGIPGVYTSVNAFTGWIESKTGALVVEAPQNDEPPSNDSQDDEPQNDVAPEDIQVESEDALSNEINDVLAGSAGSLFALMLGFALILRRKFRQ